MENTCGMLIVLQILSILLITIRGDVTNISPKTRKIEEQRIQVYDKGDAVCYIYAGIFVDKPITCIKKGE